MGEEVFEAMVNRHADHGCRKRIIRAKTYLGWMAILAILSLVAHIAFFCGRSGISLFIGSLAAFVVAFLGGRIAEMRK